MALVADERVAKQWSDPTVLPFIQYLLNSTDNSEAGIIPFHAHFGNADATYHQLPTTLEEGGDGSSSATHNYVKLLDNNLKLIRAISKEHQAKVMADRQAASLLTLQNQFQPGDLVLFQLDPSKPRPTKLTPKYSGPYEVLSQYKNDVTCKHLVMGNIKEFHITKLKMYHGDKESAFQLALLDHDQYVVDSILAYRGDPKTRTTMQFEVKFKDGDIVWLTYNQDLAACEQFEHYCRAKPELFLLIYTAKVAQERMVAINKTPITEVKPGDIYYIDIRSYGSTWYDSLPLPDLHHRTYVVAYKYTKWVNNTHRKIEAKCQVFNETWRLDHVFIKQYGSHIKHQHVNGQTIILIDSNMVQTYPELLH
jgi:ribosomal protein L21E